MFTIDEVATILNALRYYCEHNRPHVQETALIEILRQLPPYKPVKPEFPEE